MRLGGQMRKACRYGAVALLLGSMLAVTGSTATAPEASAETCLDATIRVLGDNPYDPVSQPVDHAEWIALTAVGFVSCSVLTVNCYVSPVFDNPHNPVPVYTPPAAIDANGTVAYALYYATIANCV